MAIRKYELVPPKKSPARGAKQVIKENQDVIDVCRSLTIMPSVIRIVLASVVNYRNFKLSLSSLTWDIVLSNTLLPMSLLLLSYIMKRMSKPLYSADGKILYAGYDLNLKGSWGEIFREVMAIIVLTHLFSAISPWFRHILWLIPGRIFYLIWKTTVRPTLLQIFIESGLISDDHEEERSGGRAKKNKKKIKYLRTIRHWHNFKC